jgi:hypothetical protein
MRPPWGGGTCSGLLLIFQKGDSFMHMMKPTTRRFWAVFWSFWTFGGAIPQVPVPRPPKIVHSSQPTDDPD